MPDTIVNSPSQSAQSKTQRIFSHLRRDILSGQLAPGEALPTQRQVSQTFGVTETTAWAALSRLADEGLIVRTRGRGSFVSQRPGKPTRKRALHFGRMMLVDDRYFQAGSELEWIEKFSLASRQRNLRPHWHHLSVEEGANPDALLEQLGEGSDVIMLQGRAPAGSLASRIQNDGHRLVVVGMPVAEYSPQPATYPQVVFDRHEAVKIVVKHLISLGHRRIGFLGRSRCPSSLERLEAFLEIMREHQLTIADRWLMTLPTDEPHSAPAEMAKFFSDPDRPDAVCCAREVTARGLASLCADRGVDVPGDLAIVAAGEDKSGTSAITIAAPSSLEMCEVALDLIDRIDRERQGRSARLIEPVMVPNRLTVRQSCGAAGNA